MRIFITGGTGFIGTHVVKELQDEENTLLLLTRQPKTNSSLLDIPKTISIVQGDLSHIDEWKNEVEQFQPQVAVHMAWESLPNYDSNASIKNLDYGLNLITLLAESGCKSIICTGSCWEYGQQSGKVSEDMTLKPFNAFSSAKNSLHWLGEQIARENNMHFIWTRLFYVYGPGQRETSLIPYLINCAQKGKKPEVENLFARNKKGADRTPYMPSLPNTEGHFG